MQSNRDRIKEMIEHISTFNDADPGEGISRFSYSENDAKASTEPRWRDTNVPETGSNGRRIKDHC